MLHRYRWMEDFDGGATNYSSFKEELYKDP